MRARARLRLSRSDSPAEATIGAGLSSLGGGPVEEIRRVAEEHAPEGGYGETAYRDDDGTVYWTPADWTTNDEMDAAHDDFMEIDGVNGVVGDAESRWPDDEGWEQVWPEPGSEEAYERVLVLAQRPLRYSDFVAVVPPRVHYRVATVPGQDCGSCGSFDDGHCTMFAGQPAVEENHVCDEWNQRASS